MNCYSKVWSNRLLSTVVKRLWTTSKLTPLNTNKPCLFHTNTHTRIIYGEYSKPNQKSVTSNKSSSHILSTTSFKAFLYSSSSNSTLNNPTTSTSQSNSRIFDNVTSSSILFVDPTSGIPIVFKKDKLEPFAMNSKEDASEEVIYHNLKFLANNSVLQQSDLAVRLCELWISHFGDPEDEQHSIILLGQYLRKSGLEDKTIDFLLNQVGSFGSVYLETSLQRGKKSKIFNKGLSQVEEQDEENINRLLTGFKAYPYIQLEEE